MPCNCGKNKRLIQGQMAGAQNTVRQVASNTTSAATAAARRLLNRTSGATNRTATSARPSNTRTNPLARRATNR